MINLKMFDKVQINPFLIEKGTFEQFMAAAAQSPERGADFLVQLVPQLRKTDSGLTNPYLIFANVTGGIAVQMGYATIGEGGGLIELTPLFHDHPAAKQSLRELGSMMSIIFPE